MHALWKKKNPLAWTPLLFFPLHVLVLIVGFGELQRNQAEDLPWAQSSYSVRRYEVYSGY